MTLHEDVARINEGDTVTAEFTHHDEPYEIAGKVLRSSFGLNLGPFILCYIDVAENHCRGANLRRIVSHVPKPAPLYTNRPDITEPRKYDVATAAMTGGGAYTFFGTQWRGTGGSAWTTDELVAVGPLTLVAEAIQ